MNNADIEAEKTKLDDTEALPREEVGIDVEGAVEDGVASYAEEEDSDKLISELQEQVLQMQDQSLRAMAEVENIRRRSNEEISKARRYALEGFASALLPVRDSLEAALNSENQSLESLKEGMDLTYKQLTQALERNNLTEIQPNEGDKFDPNVHQAISSVPNADITKDGIVQVLQKGYKLADRVVRPALVIVSAG
ncbi:nucleotide exchange factor GrpE [Taylorella equigenitalis]|uniref:Protein GrpE n=1 Tax=Taylorella equigenitalis ATCC 35865 TaxID=743973 RepID=A0ABM5NBG6_9BURK|nr:nucleotide exchange factor GrpE [Taylorella equigenitalis]AFN36269.1 heat shock protein [Taylorella equigenitalis ATCC 35865]ASY39668.1 nucleotide exchange factor GrpE [Taylorella equigenitalis]VEG32094.1 HSP-70 cofactor [Taylorella equigenitalis ATCC 35865]